MVRTMAQPALGSGAVWTVARLGESSRYLRRYDSFGNLVPTRERGKDCSEIDHARGHPHQQSADLLIEAVCQSPLLPDQAHQLRRAAARSVKRADRDRRKRDVDAE